MAAAAVTRRHAWFDTLVAGGGMRRRIEKPQQRAALSHVADPVQAARLGDLQLSVTF